MNVTIEGFGDLKGQAYVLNDGQLFEATDEVLEEVAREAMLLSQGAERAAAMLAEADQLAEQPATR